MVLDFIVPFFLETGGYILKYAVIKGVEYGEKLVTWHLTLTS